MSTVSVADAKAHLSRLLEDVESGEEVVITRRGQPIARITPFAVPKVRIKSLTKFRRSMPRWRKSSAELTREMRNESL